jgi:hypothetical protein
VEKINTIRKVMNGKVVLNICTYNITLESVVCVEEERSFLKLKYLLSWRLNT